MALLASFSQSAFGAADVYVVNSAVTATPNPVLAGNSITVTYKVGNQGNVNAPQSSTRIQIKDASLNTKKDQTFVDPAVSVNTTVTNSHSIAVPSDLLGEYGVYIVLDRYYVIPGNPLGNDYGSGLLTVQQIATLTIASSNPGGGVSITVSPPDRNGNSSGVTLFSRSYIAGANVTLTAPATASGNAFQKWLLNSYDYTTNRVAQIEGFGIDGSFTMTAVYGTPLTGSCCVGTNCTSTSQANCSGLWTQGGSCNPNPCLQPSGSCCVNGGCTIKFQSNCSGIWTQGGSCTQNPCPQGSCGDGICAASEVCNCFADCGPCAPQCGDHICNGTETCSSCPPDCSCPPQTGSLRVEIAPAAAERGGGRWRRVGTTNWRASGIETGIAPGSYVIEFKETFGWTKPTNLPASIVIGQEKTAGGTYAPAQAIPLRFTDVDGNKILGTCADGAAIIAFEASGLPAGTLESDIIVTAPSAEWIPIDAVKVDSAKHIATQQFQSPITFSGGQSTSYPVTFNATVLGEARTATLAVSRPPVVLLHGVWSDSSSMKVMKDSLIASGFQFVRAHNYKASSNSIYFDNRNIVANPGLPLGAIDSILKQVKDQLFTARKVDVVAHSMGAALTRYYIQNMSATKYRQDISRFITIGGVHSGSQFADALLLIRNAARYVPGVTHLVNKLWFDIYQNGAIDDLGVNSHATDGILNNPVLLGRNKVPSFAIIGTATTRPEEGYEYIIWKLIKFICPELGLSVACHALDLPDILLGTPNDLVVSGASQQGGLGAEHSAHIGAFAHFTPMVGSGLGETDNTNIMNKVIDLLNSPALGPSSPFDPNGFTSPPDLIFPFGLSEMSHQFTAQRSSSGSGTVTIISPSNGDVVLPAQELNVQLAVTGTINSVLLMTPSTATILESAPFMATIQVPENTIGTFEITVVGRDNDGILGSHSVSVMVSSQATVTALDLTCGTYLPLAVGQAYPLQVLATFSDGQTRDVTSVMAGTTYNVADVSIATVDATGIVHAKKAGKTTLTCHNGQSSAIVTIDVFSADTDGDGTSDEADGCSRDAHKTAPGACGCGIPDVMDPFSTLR